MVVVVLWLLLLRGLGIRVSATSAQATLQATLQNKLIGVDGEDRTSHLARQDLAASCLAGVAGDAGASHGRGLCWIKRYVRLGSCAVGRATCVCEKPPGASGAAAGAAGPASGRPGRPAGAAAAAAGAGRLWAPDPGPESRQRAWPTFQSIGRSMEVRTKVRASPAHKPSLPGKLRVTFCVRTPGYSCHRNPTTLFNTPARDVPGDYPAFAMASPLLHPPPSFQDFDFAFDPNLFPPPPPLPSSADLFSPSETTDLLGFLDNFGDLSWDLHAPEYLAQDAHSYEPAISSHMYTPYSNPHLNTAPDPSASGRPRAGTRSSSSRGGNYHSPTIQTEDPSFAFDASRDQRTPSDTSVTSPTFPSHFPEALPSPQSQSQQRSSSVGPRSKSLLSTPQKRLNHIMSEQKRRNAIRDGYAQLIALLAPAGAPALHMPTRGRPKGSGSRGKGQSKGKSGVLFRAVEYCKWLEEDRDALREEVLRVEVAAGIQNP